MLKQLPSRNPRARSFKVKHALQIIVVLAICTWFVYHFKQSHYNKDRPAKVYGDDGDGILKFGRKELKPRLDEELEVEEEEGKVRESEEMDAGEREVEHDHDQMQDLIDEDDKEQLLVEA